MPRPKRRYPAAAHPVAPETLTAEDHAYIAAVVEDVRSGEGSGGQCGFVAEILSYDFGWLNLGGIYHSDDGHPIGDHVWSYYEPTQTHIDATADQFGEGEATRIFTSEDPLAARYRHAETEEEEEAWLDEARARTAAEGDYWWVTGGTTNPNVVAYLSEVTRWESGEPPARHTAGSTR